MFDIVANKNYKKSLKQLLRGNKLKLEILDLVIDNLSKGVVLQAQYRDHALTGEYKGYRECHVQNDILLIYRKEKNILVLVLVDIGTHSELF